MAQFRFLSFEADDDTFSMNGRFLQALKPGLYSGYDFTASADLNLVLNHNTTGVAEVDVDGLATPKMGSVMSNQAVIVKEDADLLALPITAGGAEPRIDVIYMAHTYTAIGGGTVASYAVIQGAEAADPVAPALTLPLEQVKIGELFVPAGITLLTDVGVAYTRELSPIMGGAQLARLRTNNLHQGRQEWAEYITEVLSNSLDPEAVTWESDQNANVYTMADSGTSAIKWIKDAQPGTFVTIAIPTGSDIIVTNLEAVPPPADHIKIFCGGDIIAQPGDVLTFKRVQGADGSAGIEDAWHLITTNDTAFKAFEAHQLASLPAWIPVLGGIGFSNNFQDSPFIPNDPLRYRRLINGLVQLRGGVNLSTAGAGANTIIATLPTGFRPISGTSVHYGTAQYTDNDATHRNHVFKIAGNGEMRVFYDGADDGTLGNLEAANQVVFVNMTFPST